MSANSILNSQFSILPSPLIPPGYKQTEVGVIPEDWKVSELDTVAQILDPQPDHRTPPATSAGEPYIGISDFLDDHTVDWESCRKVISRAVDKQRLSFQIKQGDIIFGKIGTIGAPRFVPTVPFRYALSANVLLIQPMIDSYFVMSWLRSKICQKAVASELHSTSQAAFGINKMRCVMLPTPTKAEQEAIASALSDADTLIESLEQLIAKKRGIKQATMQQLLTGKRRLPGFSGKWESTALKNFVKPVKFAIVDGPFGSQLKIDEYVPSGVPIIEMEHLSNGYISEGSIERFITKRKFDELIRSAVYPRDIIISKTGTLGKLGIIPDNMNSGLITSRLAKISIDPRLADISFVFQFLLKLRADNYWEKISQGGTMQILGINMLANALIPNLPLPEQTAIAEVLTDMDAGIDALEGKLAKARLIKQGMMQELLTGKIRLVSREATKNTEEDQV